jgi:hypothetical protein
MAGVIVLWALMDISVPGVCRGDDLESPTPSTQDYAIVANKPAAPAMSEYSLPPTDSSDPFSPESCFCSCAHIVPTRVFCVAVNISAIKLDSSFLVAPPLKHSYFVYHPPKA